MNRHFRSACVWCCVATMFWSLVAIASQAAPPEIRRVTQDPSGDYQGNDESPIIKALSDLGNSAGTVVVGPGEYLIRRPIVLTSGKVLRGNGGVVLRLPSPVIVGKDAIKGQDSLTVSDTHAFAPQTQVELVLRDGKKRVVGDSRDYPRLTIKEVLPGKLVFAKPLPCDVPSGTFLGYLHNLIQIRGSQKRIRIEKLTLDGGRVHDIPMPGHIERCAVLAEGSFSYAKGPLQPPVEDLVVADCHIRNCYGRAVGMYSVVRSKVVGCCIEDIDDESIDLDHFTYQCQVVDNIIRRGQTGVTINDGSRCLVADNHIERCGVGVTIWWWHMCSQEDIDRENIVRGNWVVASRGAAISVGKRCFKNQILDNTVDGKVQVVEPDNEVRGTQTAHRIEGRVTSAGKPLAGVAVSEGLHVSTTDADGRYVLGVTSASGPFVFVSTPRGYWSEAFFMPTAQVVAAKRTDFELKPQVQSDRFDFVFVTDMHLENRKVGVSKTEASIREINGLQPKPAFLWAQGDITLQGRSGPQWQACLKLAEMPVRNGPGNHEMLVDRDNPREDFQRLFGPTYYSFDWGPVHCIVLDGNKVIRGIKDYKAVHGAVEGSELQWLRSDLRMQTPGKPIIVGIHIPIVTTYPQRRRENPVDAPYWEVTNRKVLTDLFSSNRVRLVLEGHMHENERIMVDGVEYVSSISLAGSWFQAGEGIERGVDGSPRGYRIVSVDGDKVTHRYQSSAESRVDQPGEFVDLDKPLRQGRPGRLVFNCYDAPAAARAKVRIDGGPWRDMPLDAALNTKVELKMLHHFALPLEHVDLSPGKHRLEVRVESQLPPFSATATGTFAVIER